MGSLPDLYRKAKSLKLRNGPARACQIPLCLYIKTTVFVASQAPGRRPPGSLCELGNPVSLPPRRRASWEIQGRSRRPTRCEIWELRRHSRRYALASHVLLVPQEPALRALDPERELVAARDVSGGAHPAMRTPNSLHVPPHAVQLHPVPAGPCSSRERIERRASACSRRGCRRRPRSRPCPSRCRSRKGSPRRLGASRGTCVG